MSQGSICSSEKNAVPMTAFSIWLEGRDSEDYIIQYQAILRDGKVTDTFPSEDGNMCPCIEATGIRVTLFYYPSASISPPLDGLELWLDASASHTITTKYQSKVKQWTSMEGCAVHRTLNASGQYSCPVLHNNSTESSAIEFDYDKFMEITPPLSAVQTIVSVHKFKPNTKGIGGERTCPFYIFSGTEQGPFHGDINGAIASYQHGGYGGGKMYCDGSISLNGETHRVMDVRAWTDDFKVATVRCLEPVPRDESKKRVNLIGRDRVYHEFPGYLKEVFVYSRLLTEQEIETLESYLRKKHMIGC